MCDRRAMNFEQAAIVGLLICMFIVYALEKFRVEVVAISGLAIAFLLGLVPVQDVFAGFSSPAVITVVEILLIITVLSRTRVVEQFARALARPPSCENYCAVIQILG